MPDNVSPAPLEPAGDPAREPQERSHRHILPAPAANGAAPDAEGGTGIRPDRILGAVRRFWWVLALSVVLGAGAAWIGYRSASTVYEANGALWISGQQSRGALGGPIEQGQLLSAAAWTDLLRSYAVLDPVVMEEKLYLRSAAADRPLFRTFQARDGLRPGRYELRVDGEGERWILYADEMPVDSGRVGAPVGEGRGFRWTPPRNALAPGESVTFALTNPRDAANRLSRDLLTNTDRERNIIRLRLEGPDPQRITRVLQAVMHQHVSVAAELKRGKLDELTEILGQQLETVRANLEDAERQLQSFKVATITLPTEQSSPVAPGLQQTESPAFSDYFQKRTQLEALRTDRRRIQAALDSAGGAGLRVEAFELIPAVQGSSQLETSLSALTDARAELRSLLGRYTEEYQPVQELRERIRTLEEQTIPSQARSLIAELDARVQELSGVLASRSAELQRIPARSIEEARLEREQEIAQDLFVDLRQRYAAAQLAAESSIADVRILDEARAPSVPVRDDRVRWAVLGFLGALGLGLVGVVVLDRVHPKLRYLTELTEEMGFTILGVVPRIRTGQGANTHTIVEAFREIRMRIEFAHGQTRPIMFTVTSPDSGEGKTLVTANLALAFARIGRRTLVIDADTRRGDLQDLLHAERKPGLTDLLRGDERKACVQRPGHENLFFVGAGSRHTTSPELLGSERMQEFLAGAKKRFDVILVDSPPLAAGSDAFVLGVLTGSLVLVARSGSTDKSLAKGKLDSLLRLPARILGAVLNDADERSTGGEYRYYSYYLPEYGATEEGGGSEEEERDMLAIEGPTT